jgi:hypothetical protein
MKIREEEKGELAALGDFCPSLGGKKVVLNIRLH